MVVGVVSAVRARDNSMATMEGVGVGDGGGWQWRCSGVRGVGVAKLLLQAAFMVDE